MRRIDFLSFSPGVACRWVPHHHHLRDVAELAEVLLQPLLCCLPGEATDEHLSGDGKHRYLFRQGAPLVNPIPSGFHAAAPNIVNNAGFLTLGHWSGHRQMRLLLLLQVQASFSPLRRRSRKQLNQPVSTGHADAMELVRETDGDSLVGSQGQLFPPDSAKGLRSVTMTAQSRDSPRPDSHFSQLEGSLRLENTQPTVKTFATISAFKTWIKGLARKVSKDICGAHSFHPRLS